MPRSLSKALTQYREMLHLHKHFSTYFQVVPADSPELVREAQMIRHEVYCAELGWEPISRDGLERDEHDAHALHCLLRAVRSQRYIGCVRLVLPHQGENPALPIQSLCLDKLMPGHPDPRAAARGEIAEVSRLAIVSDYRRRKNEQGRPVTIAEEDFDRGGRRRFPYIPVSLYIGMLKMAEGHGIKSLYLVTEPLLATHFSRLGGKLTQVGEAIEHRGIRKPYVMDVHDVLHNARIFLRPLIRTIGRDITKHHNSVTSVEP